MDLQWTIRCHSRFERGMMRGLTLLSGGLLTHPINVVAQFGITYRQQALYFFPLPQGQGALRETFGSRRMMFAGLGAFRMSL